MTRSRYAARARDPTDGALSHDECSREPGDFVRGLRDTTDTVTCDDPELLSFWSHSPPSERFQLSLEGMTKQPSKAFRRDRNPARSAEES